MVAAYSRRAEENRHHQKKRIVGKKLEVRGGAIKTALICKDAEDRGSGGGSVKESQKQLTTVASLSHFKQTRVARRYIQLLLSLLQGLRSLSKGIQSHEAINPQVFIESLNLLIYWVLTQDTRLERFKRKQGSKEHI